MTTFRLAALLSPAVPLALLLGACVPAGYSPRALDAEPLQTHAARSPGDSSLAALVAASGYDGAWPPSSWTLEALTLVALHFNPRMAEARAQAALADAQVASAAQGRPLEIELAAQHHSRQLGDDSPWSLGMALVLPLGDGGRRAARVDRASALAEAARLDIAASAWRVRAEVRDALIGYRDAEQRMQALAQRIRAQRDMQALVASRVDAGLLSARELGQEQAALADLEVQRETHSVRLQEALSALSAALGLPLDTVARFQIGEDALDAQPAVPAAQAARELALKNRLDIQRRLLEFGAADAEVRLAVASRYPELSLSPGYLWDQGDRIWSLATALAFPAAARGLAGVREAQARRELFAQQFETLQVDVISQTDQALAAWTAAAALAASAARQAEIAEQQRLRIERLFDAGAAGRLDLVSAQIVALSARQAMDDAALARLRAAARVEDAIEKPLIGSFRRIPDGVRAHSGASQ